MHDEFLNQRHGTFFFRVILDGIFFFAFPIVYSAFFLTVAIGNCMVKFIPPVNFCSDENIQTIFGTKLEDFLNYRIDYNSTS
jgi:hypothetical protein